MASRVYYASAGSPGRSTTTTTDFSVYKDTVDFTPNAGKTYAIFYSCTVDIGTASMHAISRLQKTTDTPETLSLFRHQHLANGEAASTKISHSGVALYTDDGTPVQQTIQLQYATNNASYAAGIQEASIVIVELISGVDIWNSAPGNTTTNSVTYADKVALSPFTPASAGDYLVVATAGMGPSSTAWDPEARMLVNASPYNTAARLRNDSADELVAYRGMVKLTNATGQQTASIQFASQTALSVNSMEYAYIVALRLDQFDSASSAVDRTNHTTTSTTFANSASVTSAFPATDSLVLASGRCGQTNDLGTDTVDEKITIGATDVETVPARHAGGNTDWGFTWFMCRLVVPSGASQALTVKYNESIRTTDTGWVNDNVVAILQLEASYAPGSFEVQYPDAIAASTNLMGAVTDIDEDADSPDANWLTATDATAATDLRVSFPTPTGVPYQDQNFKLWLRKTAGTNNPTVDVSLYQGGVSRLLILDNTPITSLTGQLVTAPWNVSSLVTTLDGSDVECRVQTTIGASISLGAAPAYDTVGAVTSTATMPQPSGIDIAVPTHAAGDCLVLHVLCRNTNNDGVLDSINTQGWTQAGGAGNMYGGAQNARQAFGWKIGDGAESVVNITTSGGTTSDRLVACVYNFKATNGFANPPVQNIGSSTQSGTSATTSVTMPSVTRVSANDLAVCLIASNTTSAAVSSSTGESNGDWTESTQGGTTNGVIEIQTSAFTGTTISGGTSAITSSQWVAIAFSLVPTQASSADTVEFGAVEWNVQYTPPASTGQPTRKRWGGVEFAGGTGPQSIVNVW